MSKKESKTSITKIEEISGKEKNITVEVEVTSFNIIKARDAVSISLETKDKTGTLHAILISESDNMSVNEFIASLKSEKKLNLSFLYQMRGNIVIVDKELKELSKGFKNIKTGDYLLILKSIENIGNSRDILFGVPFEDIYHYSPKELYKLINENTNYLDDIAFKEIEEVQITQNKDICILLKNGKVFLNGKERLTNINSLWFNGDAIYAISNEKQIYYINCNHDIIKFLNNKNEKYKKIIINPLSLTALTYDGEIRACGFIIDSGIDYKRFMNIDDIGYDIERNEVVVIKNNIIKSLFISEIDSVYDESEILLEGQSDEEETSFKII